MIDTGKEMNNAEFDLKLRKKVFEIFPWGKIITIYDYKSKVTEVAFITYRMDEMIRQRWRLSKSSIDSTGNEIIEKIANEIRGLIKESED